MADALDMGHNENGLVCFCYWHNSGVENQTCKFMLIQKESCNILSFFLIVIKNILKVYQQTFCYILRTVPDIIRVKIA